MQDDTELLALIAEYRELVRWIDSADAATAPDVSLDAAGEEADRLYRAARAMPARTLAGATAKLRLYLDELPEAEDTNIGDRPLLTTALEGLERLLAPPVAEALAA